MTRKAPILLFALSVFVVPLPAAAQDAAPGELMVKVRGTALQSVQAEIARLGGDIKSAVFRGELLTVKFPSSVNLSSASDRLQRVAGVQFVERNFIAHTAFTPNDPSFGSQWALQKIAAGFAWDVNQGDSGVVIAIIDTGVDLDHPDLADKLVAGYDFVNLDTVADDDNGHGTHCAGIASARTNNGLGIAGVGFNCSLMPIKALNSSGSGTYSAIINGIIWATDNGANVISMSLGGSSGSSALQEAVNYATERGVVVVAAAGNSNTSSPMYPAYYENCIAVGSTDSFDNKSSFSNYGTWVDVAAPGSGIYSTYVGGGYATLSGTSMATPHVAGLAGLLWSHMSLESSAAAVRARIESNCDLVGSWVAYGRINCINSLLNNTVNYIRTDFTASTYTILRGTLRRGGLERTFTSDNRRFEVLSERTGTPRAFEWTTSSFVSWTGDLVLLELTLEANTSSAGETPVFLWDFQTESWEQFAGLTFRSRDQVVSLSISNSPSRFIGPDGEVRIRFYRQLDRRTHAMRVDLLKVTTVSIAGER